MDSTSLTTSLSSDLLHFSSDFPPNIQSHTKEKLLENAKNKEKFLSSNQENSSHLSVSHFRSKSLNYNFNKIKRNPDQGKEKSSKKFDISPDIHKKKTLCKINSCTMQEIKTVNTDAKGVRSSATNNIRRKSSMNLSSEDKANILSKNHSKATYENKKFGKSVSSVKPNNISEPNKTNYDWNEISECIIRLLREVDPKIKLTTEKGVKQENLHYCDDLNYITKMLKKLPVLFEEKRFSKSNKYIESVAQSYQHFLKADLSKLNSNPKRSEIIKLLKGIFSSFKNGEDTKKENHTDEIDSSNSKCSLDNQIMSNPEKNAMGSDIIEQQENEIENAFEAIIEDTNKQDVIERVQTPETRGDENVAVLTDLNQVEEINDYAESSSIKDPSYEKEGAAIEVTTKQDTFEKVQTSDIREDENDFVLKDSNRVEEINEHIETDSSNFLPIQESLYGDNPLKFPYVYYDDSFSSFEWSENFRSLSRLSNDFGASKTSLLQRFYQKLGYVAKEPQILYGISVTPEIPPLVIENSTQESKIEQSPILVSSNKKLSASPLSYKSSAIKSKNAQFTSRKNENNQELTKRSSEFNKRVGEKNRYKTESKCNKILEEKFQSFLERKLRDDKSQKISQFQKKHNWVSEFKNCIEMIEVGKEFEKETISKVKNLFISHLSERLYNRILVKAQKHIEEEQNRYTYDLEIQEAQADIDKEKQKFQEVLSKYYK